MPHTLRRLLRGLLTDVVRGLLVTGCCFHGLYNSEYARLLYPGTPGTPLSGPPPGHPERVVPDVPLSGPERELWDQLSGPARRRRR
ncbi:DUF6059 family protein [Streptomyces sp. NPDC050704]|uniref:DUF6059 family protein n=1 Tax=Streptomyces sp. NPDC050704 TaxID=3157219 RepID=UPI0034419C36